MKQSEIIRSDYYDRTIITSIDDILGAMKRIESIFRNSKEYKNYICSVREGLDKKNCAYFQEKDFSEVKLELHHIHLLYDIILLIGTKEISELEDGKFLTVYDIVNKVIEFHMKDYPIVVMLSSTLHQLHHSNQYSFPKDSKELHTGKYKEFIKEFKDYLTKEEVKNIYDGYISEQELLECQKVIET